jgi:ABC-type hemin transport system ATPase subunit
MLTRLTIRNFKLFDEVELELGDRVVLVGPNNAGKTSALQALALWDLGAKRWVEKWGGGNVPPKRPGVTINRRDLIAVPVPVANLLWHGLHTQRSAAKSVQKIMIEIAVDGLSEGREWSSGFEFYYANEESFYCRSLARPDGTRMDVPTHAAQTKIAYLPPMSGLAANETRLDEGAVRVRLGEGRTAEVLRNLCYRVLEGPSGKERWAAIVNRMDSLFGASLDPPEYIPERGEITMSFRTRDNTRLDISASGRGQQQTLLLLAHMTANPGAVLLLDEPDAHLEILRQRQIYQILMETAEETGSQVIAASHSEVILNEAAERDTVIAFVGRPHRIDDRGSQLLKSLREIGFEDYYQAEETGWVLYLEGSTDLDILKAFAGRLAHPARKALERPLVCYVANQPTKAQQHFHGLREAKSDLLGVAIYDRLDHELPDDPRLRQTMWSRREIENYVCQHATLLAYADGMSRRQSDDPLHEAWRPIMAEVIRDLEEALAKLGKPSPWGPDIKVSDEFLTPLFAAFYKKLGLPNAMSKTNFHTLAPFVAAEDIAPEVIEVLDLIAATHEAATRPAD